MQPTRRIVHATCTWMWRPLLWRHAERKTEQSNQRDAGIYVVVAVIGCHVETPPLLQLSHGALSLFYEICICWTSRTKQDETIEAVVGMKKYTLACCGTWSPTVKINVGVVCSHCIALGIA